MQSKGEKGYTLAQIERPDTTVNAPQQWRPGIDRSHAIIVTIVVVGNASKLAYVGSDHYPLFRGL